MKTKTHRDFLGERFSYQTEKDPQTGKTLWTQQLDSLFSKWIHDLKTSNRELFKVQFPISQAAYDVLNKLKEQIGVYDDSLLIRSITITFINYVDTRKGKLARKTLQKYKDSDDAKELQSNEILKKSLYFSPNGMRDLEAYSNISGLTKSKVIQNALYSILLIYINEDPDIMHFWEESILSQITLISKAA